MKKKLWVLLSLCALSAGAVVIAASGVFKNNNGNGPEAVLAVADITDSITAANLAATSTTYADFSYTATSEVVYKGNSSKTSNGSIQLRSKSSSGIISTNTKGTIKSVTVVWDTDTTTGRTIDVYGSNTAYTGTDASVLYADATTKGTKIGSIVYGTSTAVTSIAGDYSYIGIRSNSGALYVTSITVVWTPVTTEPSVTIDPQVISGVAEVSKTVSASVKNITGDVSYAWSSTDSSVASVTMDISDNSKAVVTLVSSGSATINVIATYETSKTINASCSVTVSAASSVTETIAKADGTTNYTAGYILNDDYGSSYNSKFDIVDASASANTNNTTSIMLYSGSKVATIAKGDYVIVSGPLTTYKGTREINGFDVILVKHSAALLASLVNGSNVSSQCTTKFPAAKAHYLAMSAEEQSAFKDTAAYDTAQTRYEAWALNQGQKPYAEGAISNGVFVIDGLGNNSSSIALVSTITLLAVSGIAGCVFMGKKRKKNQD